MMHGYINMITLAFDSFNGRRGESKYIEVNIDKN